MNINDFLGIAIVGSALSVVIELIQARFGTGSKKTKLITIALSIALGVGWYFAQGTPWWQSILGILAAASTFWALVFKNTSVPDEVIATGMPGPECTA